MKGKESPEEKGLSCWHFGAGNSIAPGRLLLDSAAHRGQRVECGSCYREQSGMGTQNLRKNRDPESV